LSKSEAKFCDVGVNLAVCSLTTQVVDLTVRRSDESDLENTMEQLVTVCVCYVTSVSVCAAAQMSGVNAKFWSSLEQRAIEILEKVGLDASML